MEQQKGNDNNNSNNNNATTQLCGRSKNVLARGHWMDALSLFSISITSIPGPFLKNPARCPNTGGTRRIQSSIIKGCHCCIISPDSLSFHCGLLPGSLSLFLPLTPSSSSLSLQGGKGRAKNLHRAEPKRAAFCQANPSSLSLSSSSLSPLSLLSFSFLSRGRKKAPLLKDKVPSVPCPQSPNNNAQARS